MATLNLELLARVLMASGVPVMHTVPATDTTDAYVTISPLLSVHLDSELDYDVRNEDASGSTASNTHSELWMAIRDLRGMIDTYAPAFTRVRLEGTRYQPDFQQMDHAEIAAWRLEVIGYDWISDEPDISLEEFQEMGQDYWEEMSAGISEDETATIVLAVLLKHQP
jgi:hypothetical protein